MSCSYYMNDYFKAKKLTRSFQEIEDETIGGMSPNVDRPLFLTVKIALVCTLREPSYHRPSTTFKLKAVTPRWEEKIGNFYF